MGRRAFERNMEYFSNFFECDGNLVVNCFYTDIEQ